MSNTQKIIIKFLEENPHSTSSVISIGTGVDRVKIIAAIAVMNARNYVAQTGRALTKSSRMMPTYSLTS